MTLNHWNNAIIMFLDPKNIGFDVLLTNLLILDFWGGHLGSHLELQLFWPYLGLAPRLFQTSLGSPIRIKSQNEGTYFAHRTPLSSWTRMKYVILARKWWHLKAIIECLKRIFYLKVHQLYLDRGGCKTILRESFAYLYLFWL